VSELSPESQDSKSIAAGTGASATSDAAPEPPQPPEPGDCCHSGCEFCVDDMYQGELDRYRLALRAWQERQTAVQSGAGSSD
jgi:hypothetical protein